MVTIILAMEDSLLVHIRSAGISYECWKVVKAVFVQAMAATRMVPMRRLFRTKLEPGQPVANHVNLLIDLFIQLQLATEVYSQER